MTAAAARDKLSENQRDLTYTTVATLVRILYEKGFLLQKNEERPFVFEAAQPYEEVSKRLLGEVIDRVFRGSRENLLVSLIGQKKLSAQERAFLESLLKEDKR
jgi:predicted transcriptional regulator